MAIDVTNVVIAYLAIGGVMVGGGAIDLNQAGMVGFFVDGGDGGGVIEAGNASGQLKSQAGVVDQVINDLGGGALILINLLFALIGFMNWPLVVMLQVNAPPMAILVLAVPLMAAFYLSVANAVVN